MNPLRAVQNLFAISLGCWLHLSASDFSDRFEQIKTHATKADLFTFLYAMPKGGDLHHHSGGCWQMDTLFQVATDPARNGGNRF